MNRFATRVSGFRGSFGAAALLAAVAFGCTSSTTNNGRRVESHPGTGGSAGAGGGASTGGSGGSTPVPDAGTGGSSGDGGDGGGGLTDSGTDAGGPATLAGNLEPSTLLFVDGDTADPGRTVTDNDDQSTAQRIASPGLVGGYLGPTPAGIDKTDVYVLEMGAGEVAYLYIAAPGNGGPLPDLDLALYDSGGSLVDQSIGTTALEQVTAPSSGTYYLLAYQDGTQSGIYTMTIAAKSATLSAKAAHGKLNPAWPLVPGEALVKLKPTAAAKTNAFASLGVRPLSTGTNAIGYTRVALGGAKALASSARLDANATLAEIKRLQRSPEVLYAEPNYVRRATAAPPNDPLFSYQWHYQDISMLDAWDATKGSGAIVAVLDTGAKKSHPDFKNADQSSQLLPGYDMIDDPRIAADGDGRDSDSDDPGDRELVTDSSWHGTHVAGTVAAATDNGVGCAGIAPQAKLLPVRVLGVGGGTIDDIVQGILYAAGLPNDAGVLPAKKADVINMSLGGPGLSRVTADAVALARGAGTVVVAAAGNDGTDATFYSPAGEDGVVCVSATDFVEGRASYSNYGSVIAVAAPGGDESADRNADGLPDGVVSLVWANGGRNLYTPYEGTSMASPHVAAVVALMKSVYPGLTPAEFDSMLANTAGFRPITQDLGPAGRDDDYGYGLINANLAVLTALDAASKPTTSTPKLQISNGTLDFGPVLDSLTFEISNVGRGTLSVTSVSADQPWISVTPNAVGTNTVTVDRGTLVAGVYTGTITVVTNGGTGTVSVRMTVPSATVVTGGDIGKVYVILVDPATNVSVASVDATDANGYAFSFAGVPPGDYLIAAGTDLDGSGIINDAGEAFGMYPVTSAPQTVHVGSDQAGLDFPIRFQFDVQAQGTGQGSVRAPIRIPRGG
ncbi:MAG TPA: S8 family serine peptidase [Polyangiaceae bacterium]|nr:S8 family serine peptidase [Polyangiaceae bacterium]